MTPAVLAVPPSAPARKRGDFADWLSPVLVKELRQGLQSRLFVSAFVLVQAAMVLFVGLGLISASDNPGYAANMFEGLFEICVWVPLLVFMPGRGLRAIGDETRAQTLDLVQLTRLSSFRIVWGKWLALVAQTCLLASAMLPYAVLRYYLGRVDVAGELVWFGTLLIASMVLTAAAVGMSAAHMAVRVLILLIIVTGAMIFTGSFVLRGIFGGSSGSLSFSSLGVAALWIIPVAALYIYFFLELAASKIAPLAENHSARKRTLALALSVAAAGAGWCCDKEDFALFISFVSPIVVFVVLEALCEMPVLMPGIYRAFAMRGFAGRLLGHLLYPGWASGTIFTALIVALIWAGFAGVFLKTGAPSDFELFVAVGPMIFVALVSPLPILQLFPRLKRRFWPYLLVQLLCLLLFIIAEIIAEGPHGGRKEVFNLLAPVPTAALLAVASQGDGTDLRQWIFTLGAVADLLLLGWLCVLLFRQFRIIQKLENLSLGEKQESPEVAR